MMTEIISIYSDTSTNGHLSPTVTFLKITTFQVLEFYMLTLAT